MLYADGWSIQVCRDPTGQARPEEAGRRCCDSGEYAISGTGSAPLTSSHGPTDDAVDEIKDAQRTLCKQSLDLTDVLDTVHMASPFCWDTIFYHICGRKDCRMMRKRRKWHWMQKKQVLYGSCFFCSSISYIFAFGLFFASPRLQVNGAMYFSFFSFPTWR